MKKIYSYVLMAAMLLIGTGAWAETFTGTTQADLQAAIDAAASGTTLVFQNDVSMDKPVWLGTAKLTDAAKSITLDLNGHNISMTANGNQTKEDNRYMFILTHGELLVRNSSSTVSQIILTGNTGRKKSGNIYKPATGTQIFSVYGSYKSSRWNDEGTNANGTAINTRTDPKKQTPNTDVYFSHLELGERVKVVLDQNCLGTGISIDVFTRSTSHVAHAQTRAATGLATSPIEYATAFFSGSYGLAQGVRVDVFGDIEVIGRTAANDEENKCKAYGIKSNGLLEHPSPSNVSRTVNKTDAFFKNIAYVQNYVIADHALDTIDAPFICIHNTSNLKTNNESPTSAAVYASGYAKWLIEGHCEGNIGVFASSGTVTLDGATVESTSQTYTEPSGGGSVSGSGSAVVITSRDGYTGEIEVTISGNTEITAEAGYGIEETVKTTNNESKVDALTITGGTIEGGDAGTVVVTEQTVDQETGDPNTSIVTITGATIIVDEENDKSVQIGAQSLEEYLVAQEDTHITTVVDDKGNTTVVVSEGEAPTGQASVIDAAVESVNWKHLDESTAAMSETLTANMNLAELEINQNYAQTLTVPDGKTLTVGRVVLGKNAQLVVEAGATLIVSGTQGISSASENCIVIENTENAQATFLLNPAVTSNSQPRGTVNMNVKYAGKDGSDYYWHRFAMPVKKLESAWTKSPDYGTYLYGWDYENNDWLLLPGGSTDMEAWQGYTLTYEQAYNEAEIVTYTFKGQLLGNVNANLQFKDEGYNFFGNSYTGYADAKTLLQNLLAGGNVRGTIYMWNENEQGYSAVSLARLNGPAERLEDYEKEVASMQTFIVQMAGATGGSKTVNYADAIWNNPRYGNAPAPARRALAEADDDAFMKIVITAENGKSDFVTFTQNSSLSDAYEDGFDALKYMNNNRLNAYVTVDGADYTSVVSDNLIGKKLTLDTQNDVNYTISFKFVDGEEYAVRDNLNGQVTAIKEGNTYTFSAQPNTKIDGRFEIVGIENTITSISNTEANNEVRGIYTMLGQYVGEDFNALPAGVYIINGAKVVK